MEIRAFWQLFSLAFPMVTLHYSVRKQVQGEVSISPPLHLLTEKGDGESSISGLQHGAEHNAVANVIVLIVHLNKRSFFILLLF